MKPLIKKYRWLALCFFIGMIAGILFNGMVLRQEPDYRRGFNDGMIWAFDVSAQAVDNMAVCKDHYLRRTFISEVQKIAIKNLHKRRDGQ